jgi:hypothetical protein
LDPVEASRIASLKIAETTDVVLIQGIAKESRKEIFSNCLLNFGETTHPFDNSSYNRHSHCSDLQTCIGSLWVGIGHGRKR